MARPKKRDVTFYLVKEDVMTFEGVVPPQDDLLTFELGLANGFPYEGRLVIRPPRQSPPWWIPWLRTAIDDIGQYLNASNAAVLTLKTAERIFAITFGYGRGLMALDAFVRDFGLRVALNVVNPDSLNSVDAKTFEQLTLMTRSQTSRASSLETFRMSTVEDIMKAVTGTPTELETFGSRVTGADAAKVTYVPSLLNLHAKCAQLFEAYQAEHYKERFGFIDDLRVIRDRPQIAALNEALLQRLAAQAFGVIHMAPPEVTDVQDIEQFEFSQCPQERILDLDVEYYCRKISELGLALPCHFD